MSPMATTILVTILIVSSLVVVAGALLHIYKKETNQAIEKMNLKILNIVGTQLQPPAQQNLADPMEMDAALEHIAHHVNSMTPAEIMVYAYFIRIKSFLALSDKWEDVTDNGATAATSSP